MTLNRTILAGGSAAIILAAAAKLFPCLSDTSGIAESNESRFAGGHSAFAQFFENPLERASALEDFGLVAGEIEGASDAVLLQEEEGQCTGQGVYWVRQNPSSRLAITAPHRGSDRHTGTLAAALFHETNARAAAWNSAPRRPLDTCEHAIDLARQKNHLFSAFTLSFAQSHKDARIVQLHGFEGQRRSSLEASEAGMILSNGTQQPSASLLDLGDCLSLAFAPHPVLIYPLDTEELGARQNAQSQLLSEAGLDGFVHLEISAELRSAMITDGALRAKLGACLMEHAG